MANKPIIDETAINNRKIADDIAASPQFDGTDAPTLIASIQEGLNSKNAVKENNAKQTARAFTKDLLLLCLYQEIEKNKTPGYLDLAHKFDDGVIANGNSKEYIASKPTGHDVFRQDQFIPAKVSTKSVESHVIQMYDAGGTLNKNAYQFKKSTTLQESLWLPYFKSGSLSSFVAEITKAAHNVYNLYKFNKIATMITEANFQKKIAGVADNMFDAISGEFLPALRDMLYLNSSYNYSAASKYIQVNTMDDLIIIMSSGNLQRLKSGIKSQLFNSQFLGVDKELSEANVICLGNKIVIGDEDTDITVSDIPYCDDNTIYVVNKNALRHINQINKSGSQSYADNMTIQLTLHVWGALDILPWGQMFKYTNPNLSVLPKI